MVALLLADSLHLYEQTNIIFSRKNQDTMSELQAMVQVLASRWTARSQVHSRTANVAASQRKAHETPNLQAVDYVAWAVFQAFERQSLRHLEMLQPIMDHVWDHARLTHHTRRRPMKTRRD